MTRLALHLYSSGPAIKNEERTLIHTETVVLDNAEELSGSTLTDCSTAVRRQPCQQPTTESIALSAMTVHQMQPKTSFSH